MLCELMEIYAESEFIPLPLAGEGVKDKFCVTPHTVFTSVLSVFSVAKKFFLIVPTLRRGNAAPDAPASRHIKKDRYSGKIMRSHAGAWERFQTQLSSVNSVLSVAKKFLSAGDNPPCKANATPQPSSPP